MAVDRSKTYVDKEAQQLLELAQLIETWRPWPGWNEDHAKTLALADRLEKRQEKRLRELTKNV